MAVMRMSAPLGLVGAITVFALAPSSTGELDPTFGTGGVVRADANVFYAVTPQPDGRIVAAGPTAGADHVVARFLPDGSPDDSFGTEGTTRDSINGAPNAIALQDDGKIVVAGASFQSEIEIAVLRYTADGRRDGSFGLTFARPTSTEAYDVAALPDGGLVVVGSPDRYRVEPPDHDFIVARLRSDGTLDPRFGDGGVVITPVGGRRAQDVASSVAIDPEGRIVVGGDAYDRRRRAFDFIVARYRRDGRLDRTFSDDGLSIAQISTSSRANLWDLVLQPDGNIVTAGFTDERATLARFIGS